MKLERYIAEVTAGIPKGDRADIWNQARSWRSSLDTISRHSDDPESQSSATLLNEADYFLKVARLIRSATEMESTVEWIAKYQNTLAGRRKWREEHHEQDLVKIRKLIKWSLEDCRNSRKKFAENAVIARGCLQDFRRNSAFYNKHLSRLGLPLDSPLRPEVLAGECKGKTAADTGCAARESHNRGSKLSKARAGETSDPNGIDPVKEPLLWLKHLPAFVVIDGKRVNKKYAAKRVLEIISAEPDQLVAAVLYFGYEIYVKAAISRFLGISRRAVQYRIARFQKNAKKQDPNWAEHFRGEQDVLRSRIASRRH